jgi:hypothetical protein
MEFSVETVTPDIARKMLDETEARGFTNRGIRRTRVERMAHAIELGQWQVTHQPLAVTDDGIVLDGQHRLLAVIQAGVDVQMLVMRGADPGTFKVLDTGAVRTTGDSLKIAGFTNVNHLSATVRGFLVYDKLIGTTGNYRTSQGLITTTDVFDFLDDRDQRTVAVNAVAEASRVANGLARYGLKTSLAMSLMLCRLRPNDLGPTTVAEFYTRLGDGVALQADSPILALRRWFMHDTGYANVSNEARRPVACANTIKCLNDYALGKPRSIVAFKIGNEPFPGPLAKGAHLKYEKELERQEQEA